LKTETSGSETNLIKRVEEIFSPQGLLSKSRNFEYRAGQQQMAVAVASALAHQEHLVVEAGTGVGKSLAYLVPAILFASTTNARPSSPPHHQSPGAAGRKGSAHAGPDSSG